MGQEGERERKKNQRTFNDRVRAIKEQQVSLLSKQASKQAAEPRESREPRDVCTYSLYMHAYIHAVAVYLSLLSTAWPRTRIKGENKVERHSPLVKVVLRSMSPARYTRQRAGRGEQAPRASAYTAFTPIRFSNTSAIVSSHRGNVSLDSFVCLWNLRIFHLRTCEFLSVFLFHEFLGNLKKRKFDLRMYV